MTVTVMLLRGKQQQEKWLVLKENLVVIVGVFVLLLSNHIISLVRSEVLRPPNCQRFRMISIETIRVTNCAPGSTPCTSLMGSLLTSHCPN